MSRLRAKLFGLWLRLGHRIYDFHHAAIYAPDDQVIAVTFSVSETYIDRVTDIELTADEIAALEVANR